MPEQPKCLFCGSTITRKNHKRDSRKYCDKACYFAAVRSGKQRFKGRIRDAWAAFVDWAWDWDAQRPRVRKQRLQKAKPRCLHCGKECNNGVSKFCSLTCTKAWRGQRTCKCGSLVENAKAYGVAACESCRRIGKQNYKRNYKKELGSHRKKVRKGGGYWNPSVRRSVVFAQSKYRCYICKEKCKKTLNYNDLRAATVDMVVPAKRGGDWDYHNLRCACRKCNSLKSDKLVGQLTLSLHVR